MTENEKLNEALEDFETFCKGKAICVTGEALEMVRTAVKEAIAYRAIGTIEEFKALKDKSVEKKPIERERNYLTVFDCPTCNAELYSGQRFCDECGQSILDDYD